MFTRRSALSVAVLSAAIFTASAPAADPPLLTGQAAFGDWTTDAPGTRRLITVADLPPPYATGSSNNSPRLVARPDGAMPKAPDGFQVDLLVTGLSNPRKIITAPNGDLVVAESVPGFGQPGRVRILRQGDDGKIISNTVFAGDLSQPFGVAFYPPGPNPQYLYVGDTDAVVRFPYKNGDLQASGPMRKIADLPGGGLLRGGGHWTRDVIFSPDGSKMFVSVGSHSNVNDDADEINRADILQFNPDGSGMRVWASGIRNAVGLTIDPKTGAIWASVNERDELGDNTPPDYITRVQEGGFYGWPWFYIGNHQDPRHLGKHPELASKVIVPDVLLQAHSASLCITFYEATQFPQQYQGMAFAAEHGSWNRSRRTGYKVICVPVKDGKATGEYDDFLTGFVVSDGNVWGRPVGVTVDKQGSLIVVDDGSNSIWRVKYTAK